MRGFVFWWLKLEKSDRPQSHDQSKMGPQRTPEVSEKNQNSWEPKVDAVACSRFRNACVVGCFGGGITDFSQPKLVSTMPTPQNIGSIGRNAAQQFD